MLEQGLDRDPLLRAAIPHDYRVLFERLAGVVAEQEARYGPFDASLGQVRLGICVLDDEVQEARDAWRDERRTDGWPATSEEVMQVAAIAIRLLHDMSVQPPDKGKGK